MDGEKVEEKLYYFKSDQEIDVSYIVKIHHFSLEEKIIFRLEFIATNQKSFLASSNETSIEKILLNFPCIKEVSAYEPPLFVPVTDLAD